MAIIPIRSDNAYVGMAKQSVQGTAVAPTNFLRWLDGTKVDLDLKAQEIWEGDGSRRLSQLVKESQMVKGTIKFHPRPIELGFIETASAGASSDTLTTAAANTTLSSAASAGATTVSLTASAGLTSVGTAFLLLDPGLTSEEAISVTTPGTGAGPFVYTISGGGTLKLAHSSAAVARTVSTHTIVDQTDGNYYTIEVALGSLFGSAGITLRCVDCKIEQVKRSGKAGGLLSYEVDFVGISTVSQGSPATVTLENHPPFLFVQGTWTINGSTTGDALAVEAFNLDTKNMLDVIQAESLTPGAIIFGNLEVKPKIDLIFQNGSLFALTYWGGTSGTTDTQAIGAGALNLKFVLADQFHAVTYNVATMHYSSASTPEPKKDGKHYKVSASATGVSNQGANAFILQTIVTNGQNTAY